MLQAFPSGLQARLEGIQITQQGFITEHEVVVTPDHPRGVWVVDGVPLVMLRRALLAEGRKADIDRLARELGRPRGSVELAHRWLSERSLIS